MTAVVAAGAAVGLASSPVSGPWEPASVIMGWTAAALLVVSLMTGYTWGAGAACALFSLRTGVHGLAGAGLVDLVASTLLIFLLVETTASSFEGRRMPIHWPADIVRAGLVGAGGAGAVLVVAGLGGGIRLTGPGAQVGGLAVALLVGLVTVGIRRRATSDS